jgi:uncharacterized protein involved in type VI secretion and phage assembly
VDRGNAFPQLFGAYQGVVMQNDDPEGLYRCRIEVVGIIELTDWAFPFGTLGGGSPQRGGFVVPAVGADVIVMFVGGDPERPIYSPAWWSFRDDAKEMPKAALDAGAAAHQVQSFQLGSMVVAIDERTGQRKLSLEDTVTGDAIVWDLEKQGLRVKMTSAVLIEADGLVKVNGAQVTVQDRLVQISGKVI